MMCCTPPLMKPLMLRDYRPSVDVAVCPHCGDLLNWGGLRAHCPNSGFATQHEVRAVGKRCPVDFRVTLTADEYGAPRVEYEPADALRAYLMQRV